MGFVFYVFLFGSIILLAVTAILIFHGVKRSSSSLESSGTIIGFHENSTEGGLGSYESVAISPVIEYYFDGMRHEFVGKYYSTNMRVGDSVKLLVSTEDPSIVSIKTGLFFAPAITAGLAIVLLATTFFFWIKR